MSNLLKSGSRTRLNEMKEIKKIKQSLRTNKDLEQNKENINFIHKRSISTHLKTDDKNEKDIYDLEEKFEKRFDKIDENIDKINGDIKEMEGDIKEMEGNIKEMKGDIKEMKGDIKEMKGDIKEMKGDINNLLLLSILKENIPKEKEKYMIRKYIEGQYKKLLSNLFKESPVNNNDDDEKKMNIPNQNDNNNIFHNKTLILGQINTKTKNFNNNDNKKNITLDNISRKKKVEKQSKNNINNNSLINKEKKIESDNIINQSSSKNTERKNKYKNIVYDKNMKNPFTGTYSKDSEPRSSRKNKK